MVDHGVSQKDSISSYQTQDNYLYDPRYSGLSKRGVDITLKGRDSFESIQGKLNRESVERFWFNNIKIPEGGTFFVIARAGKYLLLVIILPPYIFLYGIPKWLMQNMFPPMFQWTKESTHLVIGYVSSSWSWMTAHTSRTVQALKKRGQAAHHQLMKVVRAIQNGASRITEAAKRLADRATNPLYRAVAITEGLLSALRTLREIPQNVGSRIKNLATNIAKVVTDVGRTLSEKPVNWVKEAAISTANFAKMVVNVAQQTMQTVWKPVQTAAHFCKNTAEQIANFTLNWVVKPIAEWIAPKLDRAKEIMEKIAESVQRIAVDVKERVQEMLAPLINAATVTYNFFLQVQQKTIQWFKEAHLGQRFIRLPLVRHLLEIANSVIRAISDQVKRIKDRLQKRVKILIKRIKEWQEKGRRVLEWFKEKIKKIPGKIVFAGRRVLYYSIEGFKLMWVFLKALFRWLRFVLISSLQSLDKLEAGR